MAGMYGADVAQLRALATRFDNEATTLENAANTVTRGVQAQFWVGPVAIRFKASWEQQHRPGVAGGAQRLKEAAAVLRRNADEQEQTSDAAGGSVAAAASAGGLASRGVSSATEPSAVAVGTTADAAALAAKGGAHMAANKVAKRLIYKAVTGGSIAPVKAARLGGGFVGSAVGGAVEFGVAVARGENAAPAARKAILNTGGAAAGAVIGTVLVPIPVVGTVVGAVAGTLVGKFLNAAWSSGLGKIFGF